MDDYLFSGLKVLDVATVIAAPAAAMMLADFGADVIKVEQPGVGDYLRDFLGQITPHHSPAHLMANRNKRSLTLDLRKDEGREIFFKLLRTTDIFVDGFAGDACTKLGIGYEAQRAVKPDIIYCQYSGFGVKGPYGQIPTHGRMMNTLAGDTPVEMGEDGLVREKIGGASTPMGGTSGGGEGTAQGATWAVLAAVAALAYRQRTGEGVHIDAAASDAVILGGWIGATYAFNYHRIKDTSSMPASGPSAKYQFYETQDAKFMLFCGIEHKFWDNFCRAAGREDLLESKNEAAPVDFAGGQEGLRREIQKIFHTRTQAEWLQVAIEHDIAMGPANTVEDLPSDPHLKEREVIIEGEHPNAGPFTYPGWPAPVEGQPFEVYRPAPELGQHNDEILGEIEYTSADIQRLRTEGII